MKRTMLAFVLSFLFFPGIYIFGQQDAQLKETESRVAELENFHDIIYPIWHTAYPEKDYAALKGYVKEVNELASSIYKAKLPGILRDKKQKWDEGVNLFKTSVDEFNKQAEGKDNEALLKAAENLHTKYELLVKIIRPVLKEVDHFHKLLYLIYHTYLPDKNYEKIISVSPDLAERALAITKAELPKRFEDKKEKINSAANELLTAANLLSKIKKDSEGKVIEAGVEKVHAKYQKLEDIF